MLVEVLPGRFINPQSIEELWIDTRHYMNGSISTLVLLMKGGRRIEVPSDSTDIYALQKKLLKACEATSC